MKNRQPIGPLFTVLAITLCLLANPAASDNVASNEKPMVIVTFGDSTTAPRGSLAVYSDILRQELPKKGIPVEVINAGIGGNTTQAGQARFQRDVLDHKPGLTVLQFGINDSAVDVWKTPPVTEPRLTLERYTLNLRDFVDRLQASGSKVILMTPNPVQWTKHLRKTYGKPPYDPGQEDGFNVLLREYAQTVREIAAEKRVPLVDVYKAFQEYGATPGQSTGDLLSDGMHPNQKGHQLVAELLLNAIMNQCSNKR